MLEIVSEEMNQEILKKYPNSGWVSTTKWDYLNFDDRGNPIYGMANTLSEEERCTPETREEIFWYTASGDAYLENVEW